MSWEVDVGSFGSFPIKVGETFSQDFDIQEYAQGRLFLLVPQLAPTGNSPGTKITIESQGLKLDNNLNQQAHISIKNVGKEAATVFILWMATPNV